MKKLLVALVALTMTASAFADGHSMVKLDGCLNGGGCNNLDFNMSTDDDGSGDGDNELKSQTIALNYAMAFGGNFGAGLTYITKSSTDDGEIVNSSDNSNTIGLSFYWNKDGSFSDSCFAALHYNMTTNPETCTGGSPCTDQDDDSKETDIVLEYGHRYAIGKVAGVTMNWSPSVSYTMGTEAYGADDTDDDKTTSLDINVGNFAATF